ncbi:winged helix-turn-helix domain-containing protein, partial [Phocaeicola vulgatus]
YEIVELLALNKNQVFSKEQIYELVWGLDAEGDCATVAEHVKKVRSKFQTIQTDFNYLKTVWGVGYKWDV